MQRRNFLAAGALSGAALLSGCGGKDSSGNTSGKPEGEITFQYFNNQPAAIAATKKIVAAFEKKYSGVKVTLQSAPADSLQEKLKVQYAGGVAPDVVQNDAPGSTLQYSEYLQELDSLLPKKLVSDIPKSVREGLTKEGKLLAVPTEQQTYIVFANKSLLKKAGANIPSGESMTWKTFEELAKTSTQGGVKGLVWGLNSPTSVFASLGLGFGATFFTGTEQDSAEASIGEAELEVPSRVRTLIEDGYADKTAVTQSTSDALPTFYGGKAAMTVAGSYQIANITDQAPKGFDWIVLPPLEGSEGRQQMSAPITLSIPKTSKNIPTAAAFLEFYQAAANLAKINIADGEIPATTSGQKAAAKETEGKNGWAEVLDSAKDLVNPTWNTFTNYESWKSTVANPAYQKYLGGETDEKQLAKELEDGWARVNG